MFRFLHATILLILTIFCYFISVPAIVVGQSPNKGVLQVFPDAIHISPDNPSCLLVYKSARDGSLLNVGLDSELVVSIDDPQIAEVSTDRRITFCKEGKTAITVSHGTDRRKVQITAMADVPVSFTREVSGVIGKSGCNLGTCHGSLHGKGGFRLSLRGDDLAFDFDRLVNEYGGRRIDPFLADGSLVLKKATGTIGHQGGQRFEAGSESYRHVRNWIEHGAGYTESSPLTRLQVLPEVARIDYGQRSAQMMVIAYFADGTSRDVTRWSRLEPSIPDGATISDDGIIQVNKSIDLSIGASFLNGRAAGRFTFLGKAESIEETRPEPKNPIDILVGDQLNRMRIASAPEVDDVTFLRRVYLVTVGRLPSSKQAREFLMDSQIDKRDRLVDYLLADRGFDLSWALRWSDLLRNEDKVMSSRGTAVFHQWLTEQISMDRPWNEWAADLVRSVGSTYENPPASFHRTHRDPMTAAESIGQVFLGVRIQCAKCHNHPFDSWRQDDYYGLSAYFTTIDRKQIDNNPKDKLDKHEITGDEIISLDDRLAEIYHPGRSQNVGAKPFGLVAAMAKEGGPDAAADANGSVSKPLAEVASWLTNDNAMFDRNMANRIWFQYFGSGIVDPPDDFRESNPPSNPELLDFLAKEFRRSGYSLRHLSRMILTSQTFARQGSQQDEDSVEESMIHGAPFFANFRIRRMSAETLIDAISAVSDVASSYPLANTPEIVSHQAMAMPGIPKGPSFLRTFGKPNRLLICECERSNQVSLVQSLSLANGQEVQNKITADKNIIGQMLADHLAPETAIDEIYMSAFSRSPSENEWVSFRELLSHGERERSALEDVMWAVINSKEFVMIR